MRPLIPISTALACLVASAGSLSAAGPSDASLTSGAKDGRGPVDVLYAGSLVSVMQDHLGPAFQSSSGYTFVGFGDGSKALATDIKGRLRPADVFISASPAVDASLQGTANGSWVSSYSTFATSPLEIGFNPQSKFAAQLKTKPWYEVVAEPGFHLGRTDPATDPKGQLAVDALDGAASRYHLSSLRARAVSKANVFPETGLVSRLQVGDLDGAFLYGVEAKAANVPTVGLSGFNFKATYTVAVVDRAPHPAAARAFVTFLTGPKGPHLLGQQGLDPVK